MVEDTQVPLCIANTVGLLVLTLFEPLGLGSRDLIRSPVFYGADHNFWWDTTLLLVRQFRSIVLIVRSLSLWVLTASIHAVSLCNWIWYLSILFITSRKIDDKVILIHGFFLHSFHFTGWSTAAAFGLFLFGYYHYFVHILIILSVPQVLL